MDFNTIYLKWIFVVLLLLKSGFGCTQTMFSSNIDFDGGAESGYIAYQITDGYICVGTSFNLSDGVSLLVTKINIEGDVQWQKNYGYAEANLFSSFNFIEDQVGSIYLTGDKGYNDSSNVVLIKLDKNSGDTLFLKEFHISGRDYGYRISWMPDSTIMIFGYTEAFGDGNIIMVHTNKNGDFLYAKNYGNTSPNITFYYQVDTNGDIYLTFHNYDCSPPGYQILKVDSEGDIINTYSSYTDCPIWIAPSLNSDDIFLASMILDVGWKNVFVSMLNTEFESVWENTFPGYNAYLPFGQLELNDGSILIYGPFHTTDGVTVYSFIRKISANGQTIWERIFKGEEYYKNELWSVYQLADGSFICTGNAHGPPLDILNQPSQNLWIIKLDSLGCLDENCDSLDVKPTISINEAPFFLFPNPIYNEGELVINAEGINIDDFAFLQCKIFSISGNTINNFTVDRFHWFFRDQNIIIKLDAKSLNPGFYVLQLTDLQNNTYVTKFIKL